MTQRFNPRWIVGKTVATVDMQPFEGYENPSAGITKQCHDPIITFTDGSHIQFITEETEVGCYGTDILYIPRKFKRRKLHGT